MRKRLLIGCALVLALGCNSKAKFVPVSGRVTLDGKPVANALVTFQPVAPEKSTESPGVGSSGKTNENGEFTLTAATGENGAVTGKHRVRISVMETQAGSSDERPPRGGWPQGEKIPKEYNAESNLSYDVPAGGSTTANFPLTTLIKTQ